MRAGILSIVLLITALPLGGCNQTTNVEAEKPHQVVVQGTGEVQAVPDRFRVRAVATARGEDLATLGRAVDEQVDAILALTGQLGLEEEQVAARELRVTPEWEHRPQRRLVGYRAERPVEIQVDRMALYARLMRGLTQAGIEQIQPLGAQSSQLPRLERQALALAVADARARATALAEAADRRLGAAVHIAEQGGHSPSPLMMTAESRAADSGEYRAGEQTVRQRVEVRFVLD